ncbi:UNVERIFIED_CONTAM: hypothetical protein FKN15_009267 [Acipenser sinensis]
MSSYLSRCMQSVFYAGRSGVANPVTFGVPQGSVLGPLLFNIYMLPLGHLIRQHNLMFHSYGDDTQLYLKLNPGSPSAMVRLSACIQDIKAWMSANFLQLNTTKSELHLGGSKTELKNLNIAALNLGNCLLLPSPTVRSLGVLLDSNLSFDAHISVVKSSFYHLRNISKVRLYLSLPDVGILCHAFVSSLLDYCNSLYGGLPARVINQLQLVQNAAARILTRCKKNMITSPSVLPSCTHRVQDYFQNSPAHLQCPSSHRSRVPPQSADLLCPCPQAEVLRLWPACYPQAKVHHTWRMLV